MNRTFIILIFLSTLSNSVLGQKGFKYFQIDENLINKSLDEKVDEKYIYRQGSQVLDYLPKNCDRSGKVDYTAFIQQAIDKSNILIFPDFPILINDKGIKFRSDQKVFFPANSRIILKSSSLSSYSIFRIESIENVELYGPKIIGDRDTHLKGDGEWGMGIRISASKNIKILNANISKCWGDGIYISDSRNINSDNVSISSPFLDYNRRNGITIASGTNIRINNAIIANTYGAMPMSGIDIEPNNNNAVIDNIDIIGYKSLNNYNSGLQIGFSKLQGKKSKNINITADNIYVKKAKYGLIVGGLLNKGAQGKMDGFVNISRAKIESSELPIKIGNNYELGPQIKFEKLSFFNSSTELNSIEHSKFEKRIKMRKNIFIK